jgi:hypothetical protein
MSDTVYGETTHENWFQREGNAFKSMCCGFVLVILNIPFIFWNETNYVRAQATADLMNQATVLDNCVIPRDLSQGQMVFSSCSVNAPDIAMNLPPPFQSFVPRFEGASLTWSLEIYQWSESSSQECTKDNRGGQNCVTKYSYSQGWESRPINSNSFYSPSGHQNYGSLPSNTPAGSYTVPAQQIFLSNMVGDSSVTPNTGHFILDANLQSQFPNIRAHLNAPMQVGASTRWQSGTPLQASDLRIQSGYLTTSVGYPQIGDVRIMIQGKSASHAGVCADVRYQDGQGGTLLGPHPPQKFNFWGQTTLPMENLRGGSFDLDSFITEIKDENMIFALLCRFIGWLLMIVAFFMIFSPLSVMADLLMWLNYCTCCLGSILDKASQAVIAMVSCGTGCVCFTIVFCAAWAVANPTYVLIGVIIIVGICVAGGVYRMKMNKEAGAREAYVSTPFVKLGDGKLNVIAVV